METGISKVGIKKTISKPRIFKLEPVEFEISYNLNIKMYINNKNML